MTVSLNTHLQNNPRGRKYSYAVRVRGFPYLWTDGLATWTYSDCDEIIDGGLGKTDFNFDFKSDPLSPLEVGGGLNITLIDEPSRRTRYLFAPDRTPTWSSWTVASTAGIIPTDTTIQVQDTAGAPTYAYLGQETLYVQSIDSGTQLTVGRARFGTTAMKHLVRFEGTAAGVRGTEISSQPTVYRGRFVDVYMAPVLEDGTAGTRYTVWAGRLGSYAFTGSGIRLSCDNLTAGFTKDDWPEPLPGIHTGTDTAQFYLKPDDMFVVVNYYVDRTSDPTEGKSWSLGTYNYTGGTFTEWTTEGWYSLPQICQAITDTIIKKTVTPGDDENGCSVYVEDNKVYILNRTSPTVASPDRWFAIQFLLNRGGVLNMLPNPAWDGLVSHYSVPGSTTLLFTVKPNGYAVSSGGYPARGFPLNKSDLMTTEGCKNSAGTMLGYARITSGSEIELVSFSSAETANGTTDVVFAQRGLGGTEVRQWPLVDSDKEEDVKIEQVLMVASGYPMDAASYLLYLLLSVDGVTGTNHATYDKLGSRLGLGYHVDHVDVDGIVSRMSLGDMPRPFMWWVDESGKGKESLEQFMKMNGVYFVTRRFERDGEYLFGLSVDLVDAPVPSRYNVTLTDAFRSADSPVDLDINERLIVNSIAMSPVYRYGEKDSDAGGKVFEQALDSINKYGVSKNLEIKASALFADSTGTPRNEAQIAALATSISLRWFGSLSVGNYTLAMECPHVGWMLQSGDRVLVSLTGIVNPSGDDGLTGVVCKVIDVKHMHGKNAGAKVTLRIATARAAELVPCFRITSIAGNPTVTLYANTFSSATGGPAFDGDVSPWNDVLWFQASKHADGSGLRVYVWERGNFANNVERGVVSTSLAIGANTLTLDSALPGGLTGIIAAGGQLLGCFIDYDDPTTLMAAYAYIGSNTVQSKLGTLDASTTDVEAFEWV